MTPRAPHRCFCVDCGEQLAVAEPPCDQTLRRQREVDAALVSTYAESTKTPAIDGTADELTRATAGVSQALLGLTHRQKQRVLEAVSHLLDVPMAHQRAQVE